LPSGPVAPSFGSSCSYFPVGSSTHASRRSLRQISRNSQRRCFGPVANHPRCRASVTNGRSAESKAERKSDGELADARAGERIACGAGPITIKGKRDYCILALLVGCVLRRRELAALKLEDIQQREGRWVIVDLQGKGGRVRTVAVPIWVKQGIDAWQVAAKIESGRHLRPLSKGGRILGEELGDWAIWSVVEASAKEIGMSTLELMICGGPVRSYAARTVATWSKSNFSLVTPRSKRRNDILVRSRTSQLRSMTTSDFEGLPTFPKSIQIVKLLTGISEFGAFV
jgi:integrase